MNKKIIIYTDGTISIREFKVEPGEVIPVPLGERIAQIKTLDLPRKRNPDLPEFD